MTPTASALRLRRLDLAAGDVDEVAGIRSLVRRGAVPAASTRDAVRAILADVRADPSTALRSLNARLGGGAADGRLIIRREELESAAARLAADVREALDQAIANVTAFASTQVPATTRITIADGVEIERRWVPLDSVGAYVPGGSAPYPSSLVMTVAPARAAGVARIVVATPAGPDGHPTDVVLGAAGLLGVDAVIVAGGAQAIGALAFGLSDDGLEPVDRIVGPGNSWVTAAKLELAGEVGIDLPAGPSEGMVLADDTADPRTVAADLITQAEHGPDSPAILVTTSSDVADTVEAEVARRLESAARREILQRALARHGAIVLAPDIDTAVDFVNRYAPEHLSIDVGPLDETVARIRHAGSVFVGRWAPESAGDYATGANHVLPTGGLARACSPLDAATFGHFLQVQRVTRAGLAGLRRTIGTLASAEGLLAHRDAVEARFR